METLFKIKASSLLVGDFVKIKNQYLTDFVEKIEDFNFARLAKTFRGEYLYLIPDVEIEVDFKVHQELLKVNFDKPIRPDLSVITDGKLECHSVKHIPTENRSRALTVSESVDSGFLFRFNNSEVEITIIGGTKEDNVLFASAVKSIPKLIACAEMQNDELLVNPDSLNFKFVNKTLNDIKP